MNLLLLVVLIFSLPPATLAADCVCVKESHSMNRIVLLIIFAALLLIPNGCKAFMDLASSSFLSNFSLEELVKKNRSPSGMMGAKGGMGGGGGGGSRVGPNQSSSTKSSAFLCQISDDSFDE